MSYRTSRLKVKVDKYKGKGSVLVKLHLAQDKLQLVGDNLVAKINQLLDEMLWFYNSQHDYLQPCFKSLILALL